MVRQRSSFIFLKPSTILALFIFSFALRCHAYLVPNVILIVADDLGWSDLGCYGGDLVETPNIDQLAKNGVRFTDFYSASPVCSPTRASILTGKHPARLHMTTWFEATLQKPGNTKLLPPQAIGNLPSSEKTIAQENGFTAALVGKWHLGDEKHSPTIFGFDENIGGTHWGAPETYFFPYRGSSTWGDGLRFIPGLESGKPGEYLTDRLTDEAVKIIETHRNSPYFLYFAHHAPHTPIEAKPELVEHFQKNISTNAALHHRNAAYAAMIKSLDDSVGRIVEAAKKNEGMGTCIIFTSDNGGYIGKWKDQPVTDNFPLRSGKGSLYEGGIRVPLIISGYGVDGKERTCSEPTLSTDLFVTIREILTGHSSTEDGISLKPLLGQRSGFSERDALFFHFPHYYATSTPVSAVRSGDWKLLEYYEDGRTELYNLHDDLSEKTNLAAQFPEKTEKMKARLHSWLKTVDAQLPAPNPNYKSKK